MATGGWDRHSPFDEDGRPRNGEGNMSQVAAQAHEEERPQVGDGATVVRWSDKRAHTIISVSPAGKQITLQRDRATLVNGVDSGEPDALQFTSGGFVGHTSGQQRWEIERDPKGVTEVARRHSDGRWYLVNSTTRVLIGKRVEWYDFNF